MDFKLLVCIGNLGFLGVDMCAYKWMNKLKKSVSLSAMMLAVLCFSLLGHAKGTSFLKPIAKNPDKKSVQKEGVSFFANSTLFTSAQKKTYNPRAAKNLSQLGLDYKNVWKTKKSRTYVDVNTFASFKLQDTTANDEEGGTTAQGAFDESFCINLREFYHSRKSGLNVYSLGRKKISWSEEDDLWRRGLWQSRFQWSKLDPDLQGLIGGFVERRSKNFKFSGFVSLLHIPDLNPDFDSEEGILSSKNPWFSRPPEVIRLAEDLPVKYKVDLPQISDIILNPGVGFKLAHKEKAGTIFLSAAYKPMNQILFKAPFKVTGSVDEAVANVRLQPQVVYHYLMSLGAKYNINKSWKLSVSQSFDRPKLKETDPTSEVGQVFKPAVITDLTLYKKFNTYKTRQAYMYLSYSKIEDPIGNDNFDLSPDEGSIFEGRFHYSNALRFGLVQNAYRLWGMSLSTESVLTYDFDQEGIAILLKNKLHVNRSFYAHLDLNYLGLNTESGGEEGLIHKYRANDSMMLGVGYVF